jgi:hypothetical protein
MNNATPERAPCPTAFDLTAACADRGSRVAAMLDDPDIAVDLFFEWGVDAAENLLVVAARAGAWAREDFDRTAECRRAFITGFVATIMTTGGWPRISLEQKTAGLAVLATLPG